MNLKKRLSVERRQNYAPSLKPPETYQTSLPMNRLQFSPLPLTLRHTVKRSLNRWTVWLNYHGDSNISALHWVKWWFQLNCTENLKSKISSTQQILTLWWFLLLILVLKVGINIHLIVNFTNSKSIGRQQWYNFILPSGKLITSIH